MARSLFDSQWTGLGGTCRSRKDVAGSVFGDHRPFQSPKELAVHFSLLFVQPGATQFLCDLEMSNSGSSRKKEAYQLPLKSEQRKKLSVKGTDYIRFTACTVHSMFRALFGVLFARELLMNSPHICFSSSARMALSKNRKTKQKNCVYFSEPEARWILRGVWAGSQCASPDPSACNNRSTDADAVVRGALQPLEGRQVCALV